MGEREDGLEVGKECGKCKEPIRIFPMHPDCEEVDPQARYLVCRCLILYFSLQWYDTDKVLSQWKNFRRAKKEALEKMVEPGAN